MKKVFVSFFLFVSCVLNAQNLGDSVIMTVAGKPVPLGEFMFIAGKNNEVNFSDSKSIESYANLFKNFKLKVAEAEALGLDTLDTFQGELARYRSQLKKDYLSDKKAEEEVARTIYNRQKEVLDVSNILFRLPNRTLSKDTIPVYQAALAAYERLQNGEEFDKLGEELADTTSGQIVFEQLSGFSTLQMAKVFENAAYNASIGTVSMPIRSQYGYHLIKLNERKPNLGFVQIAHIFIGFSNDSLSCKESEALAAIEEASAKIKKGEEFSKLVNEYSDVDMRENGGLLPFFGQGEVLKVVEDAAFSLKYAGDISEPIRTPFGYTIIKLIQKKDMPSFEEQKNAIIQSMSKSERNFELYKAFDDRLKKEYNYVFYPEAYTEMKEIADQYFPQDDAFFEKTKGMEKVLITVNGEDFPQSEFRYYLKRFPYSAKTYSGDFMREVFDLFVRDIVTELEEKNLEVKHSDFKYLVQEYRDGMLLFEVSNQKIWNHPIEEQDALEKQWIAELTEKYPVVINKSLLKKIKKKR